MIHIVWISYCKTATWFTVRFIHLVRETVLDFLFSFQFWFSLCKFASFFFLLIILVWMHLLLLVDASSSFFLLFAHVWVLLVLLWLLTPCACPMWPPLSKVNKCMRTLAGCHQIQTLTGAKLPPHLNKRLKKMAKRNPEKEKIPKSKQIQSPKGKKLRMPWLLFCNVCSLSPTLVCFHLQKQRILYFPKVSVL